MNDEGTRARGMLHILAVGSLSGRLIQRTAALPSLSGLRAAVIPPTPPSERHYLSTFLSLPADSAEDTHTYSRDTHTRARTCIRIRLVHTSAIYIRTCVIDNAANDVRVFVLTRCFFFYLVFYLFRFFFFFFFFMREPQDRRRADHCLTTSRYLYMYVVRGRKTRTI
jgi:hypothetical protein